MIKTFASLFPVAPVILRVHKLIDRIAVLEAIDLLELLVRPGAESFPDSPTIDEQKRIDARVREYVADPGKS